MPGLTTAVPQVFKLGGDVVEPALADNLMRLIAEGAGEDDEAADIELRAQAVDSYLKLLEDSKLPDILLQVDHTSVGITSSNKLSDLLSRSWFSFRVTADSELESKQSCR